jgi:hypothetical protein
MIAAAGSLISIKALSRQHIQDSREIADGEMLVTSFTFSMEQVKSAPLAVRQWIESEVVATLRALMGAQQEAPPGHSAELAGCSPEEAQQIFELIREDFATSLVFLELAREPVGNVSPTLNALNVLDIIRHTRLAECFMRINQIFQQIRHDPEAMLFGFDDFNHPIYTKRRIAAFAVFGRL